MLQGCQDRERHDHTGSRLCDAGTLMQTMSTMCTASPLPNSIDATHADSALCHNDCMALLMSCRESIPTTLQAAMGQMGMPTMDAIAQIRTACIALPGAASGGDGRQNGPEWHDSDNGWQHGNRNDCANFAAAFAATRSICPQLPAESFTPSADGTAPNCGVACVQHAFDCLGELQATSNGLAPTVPGGLEDSIAAIREMKRVCKSSRNSCRQMFFSLPQTLAPCCQGGLDCTDGPVRTRASRIIASDSAT